MPIYEIECPECGQTGETIALAATDVLKCPSCGALAVKRMSASSTLAGRQRQMVPGPKDKGCCGTNPTTAGCAGPGSCCGQS